MGYIFPTLLAIIGVVIAFNMFIKRGEKGHKESFDEYLEKEQAANFTPRKKIDESLFLVPDVGVLPMKQYDAEEEVDEPDAELQKIRRMKRCQDEALILATKKMLHFDKPMTNMEVKLAFGAVNLEMITLYEENFNKYTRALLNWAEALLDGDCQKDAIAVLQHSVDFGSEISTCYTLLADYYVETGDKSGLSKLAELAQKRNFPAQEKVASYIQNSLKKR